MRGEERHTPASGEGGPKSPLRQNTSRIPFSILAFNQEAERNYGRKIGCPSWPQLNYPNSTTVNRGEFIYQRRRRRFCCGWASGDEAYHEKKIQKHFGLVTDVCYSHNSSFLLLLCEASQTNEHKYLQIKLSC